MVSVDFKHHVYLLRGAHRSSHARQESYADQQERSEFAVRVQTLARRQVETGSRILTDTTGEF